MRGGRRPGAGRKPGSPNKRRADKDEAIKEYCDERNYDPLQAMVDLACDPEQPLALRVLLHRELAQYLYAKLARLQVSGDDEHPIRVIQHRYGHAERNAD
jgi:hypothetical protein